MRTFSRAYRVVGVTFLICILSACGGVSVSVNPGGDNSGNSSGPISIPSNYQFGVQRKTSGCAARSALADPDCTPGAIIDTATTAQICVPGYSKTVRNVPTSEKNQVYAEYGIAHHTAGEYEVDHLVSLELGGSNDIANLWPEPADPQPGFHEKDKVENYLHDEVCAGRVPLRQAQIEIATNWLAVYNQMNGSGIVPSSGSDNSDYEVEPTDTPSGSGNTGQSTNGAGGAGVHTSQDDGGGATAQCNDGTLWYSGTTHSGACARHQGVAQFRR